MKMQHGRIVPVSLQVLVVLNELDAITGDSVFVFPPPAQQKPPHMHRDSLSEALHDMRFQG
jgi:hypothetical protein